MITKMRFTKKQNFRRLIDYLDSNFNDKIYHFRGQSDSKWQINSSFFRLADKFIYDHPILRKDERIKSRYYGIKNDLKGKWHLLSDMISEEDDDYSKLSYLQHFGAPTNLIDFTLSPFIALYFSLSEDMRVKMSSIYVIDYWQMEKINRNIVLPLYSAINKRFQLKSIQKEIEGYYKNNKMNDIVGFYNENIGVQDNEEVKEIVDLYVPFKYNPRLKAQQGSFLVSTNENTDVEKLLNNIYSPNIGNVVKITYPRAWCYNIYNYLCRHNINGETLFPGIEGYATKVRQDIIFNI